MNNNHTVLELTQKIEELESQFENMKKTIIPKKIGIVFVNQYKFINKISRFISILSHFLIETGKYEVYIMSTQITDIEFVYNKKIKRVKLNVDLNSIKNFDEENNIQIYILNNDASENIDIFHSYGKKVIGIYHGAYLSSILQMKKIIFMLLKIFKN